MKKIRKIVAFIILFFLTEYVLAISSTDIKNDNLVKFILVAYENAADTFKNNFFSIYIFLLVLIILLLTFLVNYFSYQCPSCKKWRALMTINSELISEREGFKTVTRSDSISTINSSNSDSGYSNGTIYRKEQVRILEQVHKLTYKCKFCNAISQSTKTTETQNFFKNR